MVDDLGTLLTSAQTGRQLDAFVRQTQDRVYRYALSRLRNGDLAADATQETYIRLLVRLSRWRRGVDPLAWVFAFARNVVREIHRQNTRHAQRSYAAAPCDEYQQRQTTRLFIQMHTCALERIETQTPTETSQ